MGMFCFQCEQAAKGKGCDAMGVDIGADFKKFQYTAKTGMVLYNCKKVSKFGALVNNNLCYLDSSEQVFLN